MPSLCCSAFHACAFRAVATGSIAFFFSSSGLPVSGFPVSVETASTSHHEGIEDRITLAPLAGRRLAQMVSLGERLVAVELVVAAQAVDLRGRPRLDLEPVRELIRSDELPRPVERV